MVTSWKILAIYENIGAWLLQKLGREIDGQHISILIVINDMVNDLVTILEIAV